MKFWKDFNVFFSFRLFSDGVINGGFLQKKPLEKEGPAVKDTTESDMPAIVPHQTTYFNKPKHIFQAGLEKNQSQ